jgi:WD40 repeat protein
VIPWQAGTGTVRGIVYAPCGTKLVTHADGEKCARLWDAGTRAELAKFPLPKDATTHLEPLLSAVAFSACGRYLAVGVSLFGGNGPRACVYEVAAKKLVAPLLRSRHGVYDVAFLPGEPLQLLVTDGNRLLHFENALAPEDTNPAIHGRGPDRKTPKASRIAFSPDGALFATNGKPKAVIWDARTLKPLFVREHPKGPQNGPAAFDPTGEVLGVAHGTKVDLWRFRDANAPAVELSGHKYAVWAVGFLDGGRVVQTASSDGTVRTWDAATGKERTRYDFGIGKLYCAAFAPDGLTCAAGGDNGQVVLWDAEG